MIDYKGNVALVTGGASGIGKALAMALSARGADVIVADIQEDLAREVTEAVLRVAPDRLREEGATMLKTLQCLLEEGARRGELGLEDAERDARVLLHAVAAAFPTALSPIAREPEEGDLLELVDWFLRRWRERA